MTVSETDLETVETYLDDELSDGPRREFEARVAGDVDLSTAVATARQDRAVRATLWQAMRPTAVEADRLTWRVRGAMLDHNRRVTVIAAKPRASSWRLAGAGSAAAACLLVGFVAGRGNRSAQPTQTPQPSIARNDSTPDQGQFIKVQEPRSRHLVPITENGRVVAWQPFSDEEKAKSFAEEMNQANAPADGGQIKLADHEERF